VAERLAPALRDRALRLSQRLARDGIGLGDRVATMAWNTWRHVEAWYGITGLGAIYHTLNPRLFPDQIAWILNHAESRMMLADLTFVPLLEKLAPQLPHIRRYVILTDAAHMPATSLPGAVDYESWLAEADGDFAWASFEENTAAGLCYTSGTTGDPKGVLYSHRSNVLHAMACALPDMFALSAMERVMPVVPMFHANGWSLPFSAPLSGAALVRAGQDALIAAGMPREQARISSMSSAS
jgi:fatty-acyl-CoA synthase